MERNEETNKYLRGVAERFYSTHKALCIFPHRQMDILKETAREAAEYHAHLINDGIDSPYADILEGLSSLESMEFLPEWGRCRLGSRYFTVKTREISEDMARKMGKLGFSEVKDENGELTDTYRHSVGWLQNRFEDLGFREHRTPWHPKFIA